jgi:hypothetical protein
MTTPQSMPGAGESRLLKVRDLLSWRFHVPQFQRPYDWGLRQVGEFTADLEESASKRMPLFLGLVVMHGGPEGHAIIDGQQRLTTIMLALAAVGARERVLRSDAGPTTPWIRPRAADVAYAKALLMGEREDAETLSQQLMATAFDRLAAAALPLDALLDCEVIVYVAPYLAGATRLFERINLRGKDVSEFDLVKNRLIESAMRIADERARRDTEAFVTSRYDRLYHQLDPRAGATPFDSDKLLKLHWILFSPTQFKSGERVLERLGAWMERPDEDIGKAIEAYLDSLVKVAQAWVSVERTYEFPRPANEPRLNTALLDFARLGREGALQPLIVAAILAFGEKAHPLVRFCEINSLRAALAQKNSNFGRALKWRLARQLHAGKLVDAIGRPITTPEGVVHQLFWLNTPWWGRDEARAFDDEISPEQARSEILPDEALDSPKFLRQYRGLVHYLFWNYGRFLHTDKTLGKLVRVDISQFQEPVWFANEASSFRRWDIEHIYPQRPSDRSEKAGRRFQATMEDWLNHLGNLTVLPIRDNRGVGNADFKGKLEWMQKQHKVPFNELLEHRSYTGNLVDKPHWGPHNCRKRGAQIRAFAAEAWGANAVRALGVGDWDDRVDGSDGEDLELEEITTQTLLDGLKDLEDSRSALLHVHLTKHPAWRDFRKDFGTAAPHKLILAEAIDHVERMIEVAQGFWGLDEVEVGLDDLLAELHGADENVRLDEADDDEAPSDDRLGQEADYAQSVTDSAHGLVDSVQAAQSNLPLEPDELETLDEGARKASEALSNGLERILRLVNMLFEQWDGSR